MPFQQLAFMAPKEPQEMPAVPVMEPSFCQSKLAQSVVVPLSQSSLCDALNVAQRKKQEQQLEFEFERNDSHAKSCVAKFRHPRAAAKRQNSLWAGTRPQPNRFPSSWPESSDSTGHGTDLWRGIRGSEGEQHKKTRVSFLCTGHMEPTMLVPF